VFHGDKILYSTSIVNWRSKEAEVALHESASDQVVYNTSGSFDVGALDANGNPYITYNQNDLKELAACAVSEDNV